MSFLEIENLSAYYGKAEALHSVDIEINEGEIVGIIGPNGAGKSTLLDSIMGLTKTEGDIRLEGKSIIPLRTDEIVRKGVAYAPEAFNLFPYMSVRDNLLIGGYTEPKDIDKNLALAHKLFPRLQEREHQETVTQSGGERQMVSLARALMTSPRLLMVDEPTIGLAPKICSDIEEVLRRLNKEEGLTILITEQNVNFAMHLADRLYVLETGSVQASGPSAEIMADPKLNEAYFGI